MIGAFWQELFTLTDAVKKEYGVDSDEYRILKELDNRFQRVYDQKNAITHEVIGVPLDGPEGALLKEVDGLRVTRDDEGFRYLIDGVTCDTPAEVLFYLIRDRNRRYESLMSKYEDAIFNAIERTSIKLFNHANADFHEAMDEEIPKARKAFREKIVKESE